MHTRRGWPGVILVLVWMFAVDPGLVQAGDTKEVQIKVVLKDGVPTSITLVPETVEVRPGDNVVWKVVTDPPTKGEIFISFLKESPFPVKQFRQEVPESGKKDVDSGAAKNTVGTFDLLVAFFPDGGSNGTGSGGSGSVKVVSDRTPPDCKRTRGPASDPSDTARVSVDFLITDNGVGLKDPLLVLDCTNAEFFFLGASDKPSGPVGGICPSTLSGFDSGAPQVKIRVRNAYIGPRTLGKLKVCDTVGNCRVCDPVIARLVREVHGPVRETYTDIPKREHFVTLRNGMPGLRAMKIWVNGFPYHLGHPAGGRELTIDVAAAMIPGNKNIITVQGDGVPGATALLMIWDGRE